MITSGKQRQENAGKTANAQTNTFPARSVLLFAVSVIAIIAESIVIGIISIKVNTLNDQIAFLNTERDGSFDELKRERDTLQSVVDELERERDELQQRNTESQRRLHGIAQQLNDKEGERDQLQRQLDAQQSAIDQTNDFITQRDELQRQNVALLAELAAERDGVQVNAVQEHQARRQWMVNQLQMKALREQMEKEMTQSNQQMENMKVRMRGLENECASWRSKRQFQGQAMVGLLDSAVQRQIGPDCWKHATASWLRGTMRELFFRKLPTHDEIVDTIQDPKDELLAQQIISIEQETEKRKLRMVCFDLRGEGELDRAQQLLHGGHPLLLILRGQDWIPIRRYKKEKSKAFLTLQEWEGHKEQGDKKLPGHSMVVTHYIPAEGGKPNLYRIKNSHGVDGGSPGQNGYILIEDILLRDIGEMVYAAMP